MTPAEHLARRVAEEAHAGQDEPLCRDDERGLIDRPVCARCGSELHLPATYRMVPPERSAPWMDDGAGYTCVRRGPDGGLEGGAHIPVRER